MTITSNIIRRTLIPAVLCALVAAPGLASAVSYDKSMSFSRTSGDFGVDVSAKAGVAANLASSSSNYFYARAFLDVNTRLFDRNLNAFDMYGGGGKNSDGSVWGLVYAKVLGITIDSWSTTDGSVIFLDKDLLSIPVYGVSASASFRIAGIPVDVEAQAGGLLNVNLTGRVDGDSADVTVTPSASIGANCTASVDVWVAAFGVDGSATLIEVGTPATAEIVHNGGTSFTANYSLDYYWEALSGSIEVWVRLFGVRYDETIINYGGYSGSDTLIANSFNFSL